MKLLDEGSLPIKKSKAKLNYQIYLEAPRRRTVLVNNGPESLSWPWMIFMVLRKGKEFRALVALCSATEPKDFSLDTEYCVPDLSHGSDFFGICLGNASRRDPISSFWNSSFQWKWVPDDTQWNHMLFRFTRLSPRKILDVYANEHAEAAYVAHAIAYHFHGWAPQPPRTIPVKGRVLLGFFPTIFLGAAIGFGFTDLWYVTGILAGLGWWLSGFTSAGCERAYDHAYGIERERDPTILSYLAGPVALISTALVTRGFRYGWR